MKNILLTGFSGFVGSYFIDKYKYKYNFKTFSFRDDNFSSLHVEGVDVVVHLSALVHQMDGASEEEYKKVNITQTLDLAKKAKKSGVRYFIFMSTIAVYGQETGIVYEYSTCRPITEYGRSKFKAENELLKLEDDNFKVSIIRSPIVNGFNAPGNMKSLINLVSKLPVLPFANINNKRSMVYVGNLCHLIDEIIKQEVSGVFLASDDKAISTTELIELIAKNLEKKVYLIKIPFFESLLKLVKPYFHKRLFMSLEVDNTKTKETLKFENLYSVEDGIRFMIVNKNILTKDTK